MRDGRDHHAGRAISFLLQPTLCLGMCVILQKVDLPLFGDLALIK
jgi:hypothetical protein